jgi:hypothetical protein
MAAGADGRTDRSLQVAAEFFDDPRGFVEAAIGE